MEERIRKITTPEEIDQYGEAVKTVPEPPPQKKVDLTFNLDGPLVDGKPNIVPEELGATPKRWKIKHQSVFWAIIRVLESLKNQKETREHPLMEEEMLEVMKKFGLSGTLLKDLHRFELIQLQPLQIKTHGKSSGARNFIWLTGKGLSLRDAFIKSQDQKQNTENPTIFVQDNVPTTSQPA